MVETPDGDVPISEIEVGDTVIAYNEDTGAIEEQTVTHTYVHDDDIIVTLSINGEDIETTPTHPFYTDEGWVEAEDLELGDAILSLSGIYGTVEAILIEERTETMYDLTVESVHTFAVGEGDWVVHNTNRGIQCFYRGTGDYDGQIKYYEEHGALLSDATIHYYRMLENAHHGIALNPQQRLHWAVGLADRYHIERVEYFRGIQNYAKAHGMYMTEMRDAGFYPTFISLTRSNPRSELAKRFAEGAKRLDMGTVLPTIYEVDVPISGFHMELVPRGIQSGSAFLRGQVDRGYTYLTSNSGMSSHPEFEYLAINYLPFSRFTRLPNTKP